MDFKTRAVEMSLQEGVKVQKVADGLGIHPFMLSRWRKEYRGGTIVRDRRRRMDVMGSGSKKAAWKKTAPRSGWSGETPG